ncbi:MAG: M81 family metallopeptidase [Burkholderiaceae bacterium]
MKVMIAGLATETNTFSPIPTGRRSFEETFLSREATRLPPNLFSAPLHEWRRAAEARGWDVVEGLSAFAQPAGTTLRATYESLRDEILADVRAQRPDILLLSMHGAMIAEGYDDCEGDTLAHARTILGPDAVIGLEIDPHAHLTELMLANANLIVCYKEYPHIDSPQRARELFAMAADAAEGRTKPVMRDYDCRMLTVYQTPIEPMRGFVDAMQAREGRDGILSLSLAHGFPWGDSPRLGTRMLAIADGDAARAETVAAEFGSRLWALREQLRVQWPSIDDSLDKVRGAKRFPLVLADTADNAGGGAPADSSYVLRAVLDRGMRDVAIGIFWDPMVVRTCVEVGVGATLDLRLGGKVGPMSGDPVDLRATVRGIRHDMTQMMGETEMPMGTGVWLEADGVHLVLSDHRTQAFHPSAFTDLGVPLAQMKAIVAKSTNHFRAGFAPIAAEIIHMASPGALSMDFGTIAYAKARTDFWPVLEDPFAARS